MRKTIIITILSFLAIVSVGYAVAYYKNNHKTVPNTSPPPTAIIPPPTAVPTPPPPQVTQPSTNTILKEPVSNAKNRVTKKPFGIKISPTNSPVTPEKFSWYHTGVDFETTPEEQDANVTVSAICNGKLKVKRTASGYGGVVVQTCTLNDSPITVIYGHLKISSVTTNIGTELTAGNTLGILGKGFSSETDGERKHLHLGIHKGADTTILGYVQKQGDLSNWLNIVDYLQ